MSLYSFLLEKDKVYIGADTRQGAWVDGEYKRLHDESDKIICGKNYVATVGGSAWLCNYIRDDVERLRMLSSGRIDDIKTLLGIAQYSYDDHREILKQSLGTDAFNELTALVDNDPAQTMAELEICAINYNPTTKENEFYALSSERDMKLEKYTLKSIDCKRAFIVGGFENETAHKSYNKYRTSYESGFISAQELFQKVYEDCAGRYVGGTLNFIEFKDGQIINRIETNIKEAAPPPTTTIQTMFGAHNIIGKTLELVCNTPDGTVQHFKFDGNGAWFHNTGIRITSDDHGKGNGITLGIGENEGLMITRNDGMFRAVMNANEGLYFQKAVTPFTWKDENKTVTIDTNGSAVLGGDIHARRLYLQEIGGENILTYIDQTFGSDPSYTNGFVDNGEIVNGETTEAPKVKLSGNYIEGRGLKAYDENNNLRVHIDGSDGSLKMYNGYIEMQNVVTDSNGRVLKDSKGNDLHNELSIDPDEFIKWTIKNEPKFYYDDKKDALVFGGLLKTDTLSVVTGNDNTSWFTINSGGISDDRVVMTTANSRPIDMQCGSLMVNSNNVATQSWVNSQLKILQDQIDALKTSSPPILP